MSIDVLPSCSSQSSLLFDQFSAQIASAASIGHHHHNQQHQQQQSPPSPPPGRAHRNNKKFEANADFRFIQNAVAMAVLTRLHRWCCQLFWLTIVCLIGVCSDHQKAGEDHQNPQQAAAAANNRARTFQEVRKSIVQASQRRGCKTLHELEMQVNSSWDSTKGIKGQMG
jgi:hypothetical protein